MLTDAQKQALKTYILADPVLAAKAAALDYDAVATGLNAASTFVVWRSSLPVSEVLDGLVAEDWTAMDNLTVGQDRIWVNLKEVGSIKPSSAAHRAALTECWKGTAAKVAVKDRILAMGKRVGTVAEKALATGTGTDASPGVLGFEGQIGVFDINGILNG